MLDWIFHCRSLYHLVYCIYSLVHLLHYSHWKEGQKEPEIISGYFLPGLSGPSCFVPNVKRVEEEAWVCTFYMEGSRGRKQQDECLLSPIPHWHTYLNTMAVEKLCGFKIYTSTEFSSFTEAEKKKRKKKNNPCQSKAIWKMFRFILF